MKKRVLVLLLVVLLLGMLFAGCADESATTTEETTSTEKTTEEATEKTEETEETVTEPVTLDILFGPETYADDSARATYLASDSYAELVRLSGFDLTMSYADTQKFDVMLAGGDITDIVIYKGATYYKTMVEGEMAMAMDDLLEENGADILALTDTITFMRNSDPNGEGLIYAVPHAIGAQGSNQRATNGTYVWWDYYLELGCPECKDQWDYLDVLEQMQQNHPETEDGDPIYAISFFASTEHTYPMTWHINHIINKLYNTAWSVSFVYDGSNTMSFGPLDDEGLYWQAAEWLNEAYSRGLVDPDSFTQTNEDFMAKFESGQVLTYVYARSTEGWEIVPIAGSVMYENTSGTAGWSYSSIGSNCENPEGAMQFLNWIHTPEAARLIYSGVEGVHWTYNEDGEPEWTEETSAIKNEGGDAFEALGFNNFMMNFVGLNRGMLSDDGYQVDLARVSSSLANNLNESGKEYIEYYSEKDGVEYTYPNEVLYAHGLHDASVIKYPVTGFLKEELPEDISRICASMLNIMTTSVPAIVMCDPDEFETVKEDVKQQLIAIGAKDAEQWYTDMWQQYYDEYSGE